MVGIGLEARSAEHRAPRLRVSGRWFLARAAINCDLAGRVVPKMRGVDDQLPGISDEGETKNHEVMSRVASPTGLPALPHRPGLVGAIQLRSRGVEVIAACHHRTAVPLTGEVNRECIELAGVGNHPTVD